MSDELNGTMMQHFHWYSPDDGTFWDEAGRQAAALAQAGFTAGQVEWQQGGQAEGATKPDVDPRALYEEKFGQE